MTVAVPDSDNSMEWAPGAGPSADRAGPGGAGTGLAIWTEQSQDRCVLRLRGRLCADTVRLLDCHVDLLGCQTWEEVVMDLRQVDSMDEVGARLIVGFVHYVAGRGGRLAVEGAVPAVRTMLNAAAKELAS